MSESEPIRLQKFLAETGICSRRDAEVLIREGEVWVNAVKAIPGQKVTPGVDKVTVSGKTIKHAKPQPKIVLIGDPAQIDNPYVDARSNGLVYCHNRMKGHSISAHVKLTKGERSKLAELAADLL